MQKLGRGMTMLLAPLAGGATLENVALGKVVELLPVQPNYRACSDPDDAKQSEAILRELSKDAGKRKLLAIGDL